MKFDIIIVGAGPGGYVAAVRAAQLGMKTAIVEREHLGGICLNWGCIPTKALLRSAEVFELMRNAKDYGLAADNVRIDADAIVQRSRAVSGRLSQGVSGLLKKNKVQTIWGEALLTAPGRLSVAESAVRSSRPRPDKPTGALGSGDYTADHIVIATGSRPRILPGLEPDGERIWTYFEAMTPKRMPERLLVIGSGAIGVEFASFYSGLGSKVTMVEALPQILPTEDGEIASFARAQFEKLGIAIRTCVTVKSANRVPDGRMVATVEGEGASEEIVADAIIVAVGVQGNVENLGLETLGVKLDRGCIAADGYGRTNVPGL
jgi:dihydrolipoamide dehydrogenase